jgi:hypothetical protein
MDGSSYVTRQARVGYGSLIDVWHLGGHREAARECAALAVRQGVWTDPLQRARDHVPGLDARPLHDPADFWFTAYLEEQYPLIRAEIEALLDTADDPVEPTLEDGWLTLRGAWRQAYLFRDGRWQEEVCALLPVTRAILSDIPEITTLSPGSILISRLSPGTHIMPHCGSTNAVLRMHLGISVPPGASIRVGEHWLEWSEGRCLIFDDSYEHEVRQDGERDRVVLILDIAHPGLDEKARDGLLNRRPRPEDHITAFMRERGFARLDAREDGLRIEPDSANRERISAYLDAVGATAVELRDDQVVWDYATTQGGDE